MGLFDGIKLVGELVKGGIAAAKASGKLDTLVERSQGEFGGLVKPEQAKLYQDYAALRAAQEAETDADKSNALMEKAEAAEVKYLSALEDDASFPKAFRAEIALALEEYARTNEGMMEDILGKYMMKQAKTPEEQEAVRLMMEGGKVSMKLDKLAARAQDEFGSLVKPEQAKLYQAFEALSGAQDKEKDTDKKNAMTNDVEAARAEYLNAVAADTAFPQDFRDEITATLAEYKRLDDAINAMN
ncbi:MAG: hypothetical protein IJR48_08450 [Oscillibacter sp.]|nr:hypothetical protein [Oscillibacter sp.]